MAQFVKTNRQMNTFISWDNLEDVSSEASAVSDLFVPIPEDELKIFEGLNPDAFKDVGVTRYQHVS